MKSNQWKATNHSNMSRRAIKQQQFDLNQTKIAKSLLKKEKQLKKKRKRKHTSTNTNAEKKKRLVSNKLWKVFDSQGIDISSENTNAFFDYYRATLEHVFEDDKDFNQFVKSCTSALTVTFRLQMKTFPILTSYLVKCLENEFDYQGLPLYDHNKSIISRPLVKKRPLLFRSHNKNVFSLFELFLSHEQLAKSESVFSLKNFLAFNTKLGLITRQSFESMLPVFALKVQPDSKVLDVCAAPGSKSEQICNFLSSAGYLVSCDLDKRRLEVLRNKFKYFNYPNILLLNTNAFNLVQFYNKNIFFDRIILDVPCSGDGTIRKKSQQHLLRTWNINNTEELEKLTNLQLNLLLLSFCLLEPKGRLVYSTCSLNPKENNHIIQQFLQVFKSGNSGEQDKSNIVRVVKDICFDDFKVRTKEGMSLVLPQDNNTGGFFFCVIEKVRRDVEIEKNIIERINKLSLEEKDFVYKDHSKFRKTSSQLKQKQKEQNISFKQNESEWTVIRRKEQSKLLNKYFSKDLADNENYKLVKSIERSDVVHLLTRRLHDEVASKIFECELFNFTNLGVQFCSSENKLCSQSILFLKDELKLNEINISLDKASDLLSLLESVVEENIESREIELKLLLLFLKDTESYKQLEEAIEDEDKVLFTFKLQIPNVKHKVTSTALKSVTKKKISKRERKLMKRNKFKGRLNINETTLIEPKADEIENINGLKQEVKIYFEKKNKNIAFILTPVKLIKLYLNIFL